MDDDIVVRRATESDLPVLGQLGALLMQTHYAFDKQRFMAPGPNPAEGYGWFLVYRFSETYLFRRTTHRIFSSDGQPVPD